jgi:hypothetical protein
MVSIAVGVIEVFDCDQHNELMWGRR